MARIKAVREGLQILEQYDPDASIVPEHDEIFAGHDHKVSDEDKVKLEELGWEFDEDICCWKVYT